MPPGARVLIYAPRRRSRRAVPAVRTSAREWQTQMASRPRSRGRSRVRTGGQRRLRDRETANARPVRWVDCQ